MSIIKPALVVIAGPNGSGKTEITKILRTNYPHWTKAIYAGVKMNPFYNQQTP